MRRLCLAGGGTGGHVTPLLALAEEWTGQGGEVRFVGAAGKIEERMVPAAGFPLDVLHGGGRVKGMGTLHGLRSLSGVPAGVREASRLLRMFRPDLVLGAGGWPSFAAGAAALLSGIPLVLCEQNSIPGLTNRVLSRGARRVCTSFMLTASHLDVLKVVLTGNPVRAAFRSRGPREDGRQLGTLLVLGGSQGARFLNTEVAAALGTFLDRCPEVCVVHQCGEGREAEARGSYGNRERARVVPFIENVAKALEEADLVISRAGATTIAELTAMGVPAALIPFPQASDNHQEHNALAMERSGGARLFVQALFDPAELLGWLESLRSEPGRLAALAAGSRAMGRPDAAAAVIDVCREVAR